MRQAQSLILKAASTSTPSAHMLHEVLRVQVCRLSEVVEGELRAFTPAGFSSPVLVTRIGGEVIATAGICPHEDVMLVAGELCGYKLTCPGHAYEFDVRTGACSHDRGLHLPRYQVWVEGDVVFVDLIRAGA